MVTTEHQRERGGGEVEEGKGAVSGDGQRLGLEWWTQNTIYRWCIIESYPKELFNFITQCCPNTFNENYNSTQKPEKSETLQKEMGWYI